MNAGLSADWTEPFWSCGAASSDPLPGECIDVAIIGGGFTGLIAALVAARRGRKVAVLDATRPGAGASGRNAGYITAAATAGYRQCQKMLGDRKADEFWRFCLDAAAGAVAFIEKEGLACGLRRTGRLTLALSAAHHQRQRDEANFLATRFDSPVTAIAPADVAAYTGLQGPHGGLLDPQTWGLDPGQLVAALMRAVQAAGGSVCFPQRVRRVSVAGGSSAIALLETDGPPIRARSALVALDGYADSLRHPWHRRVFPVGSALLVTEPLDAASLQRLSPQGVALETSETFKRYLRLLPDRRLLIGGRNSLSAPEQQPQAREQLLARAIEWLGQELPDLRVAHAWPGRLGFTRTRLPIIGRQGPLVFVGGYCGHGIPISIGLGQMAGAWLAEDSELPTHALLNRLPPRMIGDPLRRLVMAGLGVFYRHRDRIAHG